MTKRQRWQIAVAFLVAPLTFAALPGPARHSTSAPGESPGAAPFVQGVDTDEGISAASSEVPTIAAAPVDVSSAPLPEAVVATTGSIAASVPTSPSVPGVVSPSTADAVPVRTQGGDGGRSIALTDPGAAAPTFTSATGAPALPPALPAASPTVTAATGPAPSTSPSPATTSAEPTPAPVVAIPSTTPSTTPSTAAAPVATVPATNGPAPTTIVRPRPTPTSVPARPTPTTILAPVTSSAPSSTARPEGVLVAATDRRPVRSDGVGAFRTICAFSHMVADDPIVAPGRPGGSHLHSFFGNDRTDADTTTDSIMNQGASTCRGGTANRSAYWTPSIVDTATGRAVEPAFVIAYYKSGYLGVAPEEITTMPAGLRIISGDARAATPDASPSWRRPVNWNCGVDATGDGTAFTIGMQSCAPGEFTRLTISFPQCWNGRDLDSPDHQSHMAWPDPDAGGCPASHPVAIPQITLNFYWPTPAGGNGTWRLSSDMYAGGVAGWSGHADWWNGWDPAIADVWVQRCVRAGLDCSVELLGDGRELAGGMR